MQHHVVNSSMTRAYILEFLELAMSAAMQYLQITYNKLQVYQK